MKKICSIAAAMLIAMAATAQTEKKCDNVCANDSIVADTIVVYTLKTGKVGEGVVKGYKAIVKTTRLIPFQLLLQIETIPALSPGT